MIPNAPNAMIARLKYQNFLVGHSDGETWQASHCFQWTKALVGNLAKLPIPNSPEFEVGNR